MSVQPTNTFSSNYFCVTARLPGDYIELILCDRTETALRNIFVSFVFVACGFILTFRAFNFLLRVSIILCEL